MTLTITNANQSLDLMSAGTDPEALENLTVQHQLAQAWVKEVRGGSDVHVVPTVDEAIKLVTAMSYKCHVQVLVTGSLHLVGAFLEVMGQRYPHIVNRPNKQD